MVQAETFQVQDFLACCGSSKFAAEMVKIGPFSSLSQAVDASRDIWWNKVNIPGWLEAFGCHPRIGDVKLFSNKKSSTSEWSKDEQSTALDNANDFILQELAEWNLQYEEKFGFVFLIFASGKSSSEILSTMKARLSNGRIHELQVAAGEQQKITELRLSKFFTGGANTSKHSVLASSSLDTLEDSKDVSDSHIIAHLNGLGKEKQLQSSSSQRSSQLRSPITTHVLDVSRGRPGAGIEVVLETWKGLSMGEDGSGWLSVGSSTTNTNGRSGQLIPPSDYVNAGKYRLTFNTGKYFSKLAGSSEGSAVLGSFYPYVSVVFEIKPSQVCEHFHIPLLLSPFSYTTYRGS